jgi:hypothetical protein
MKLHQYPPGIEPLQTKPSLLSGQISEPLRYQNITKLYPSLPKRGHPSYKAIIKALFPCRRDGPNTRGGANFDISVALKSNLIRGMVFVGSGSIPGGYCIELICCIGVDNVRNKSTQL